MGGPCAYSLFLILCIITTTITDGFRGVGGAEHNGQVRSCHEREKQALLKFKQSFSSDPFNRLSSWVEEHDCCLWSGVACNNVTGHVTKLDLRNVKQDDGYEFPIKAKALRGNLLNPCLLELSSLSYLDLSGNDFNWTAIPSFLSSFTGLRHLDLSDAWFGGRVPYQIGNLSNLQYLRLGNQFEFPSDLYVNDLDWLSNLSSLKHLDMSGIYLGNITHLFDNINRLTSLTELHLGYCSVGESYSFTTTINFTSIEVLDLFSNDLRCHDLKFVQNLTSLLRLDLSENLLDCPIPHVFNKMAFLTHLDLSESQLEGTITDVFSGLMNLVDLCLSYNNLTGHLPDVLGGMTWSLLERLYLRENKFSGHLPDVFRGMASLKFLDLSINKFTGHLPNVLSETTSLEHLDLSYNKFSGHLPDVFGGMASLTILYLHSNNFSGSLPQSINQLLELRVLDVSSNSLDGVISESHLSNLSKLQMIDISFNSLHCTFSSDWIPPLQLNEIRMPSCSMGPLFPAWLQSLKNLSDLDISDNGIRGTIPNWYWIISSTMWYMNLSHNHIVGKLPYLHNVASISPSSLSNLIDLSSNQLEGPIPQISPNITSLNLSKNRFSGSLSSFLCNANSLLFNSLSFLDLSENLLSGEIPDCWMYWTNITVLNLANNKFSEEIPSSMGLMQKMHMLILRNNSFTGDLSFLSKNLTYLGLLEVSVNRLSGSIPKWIGELQSLQVLMLQSNELDGYIPAQLCHLGDLRILDLARNKLQGTIPHCLGNFSVMTTFGAGDKIFFVGEAQYMGAQSYEARVMLLWKGKEYEFQEILHLVKMIDLSSNQLYGVIPEELTKLLELVALNLSRNNLTGTIPNKVGSLKKLGFLDFSRNRLSGHIPMDMSNLTSLGVLDLSNNNLSGEIPQSTQLQSFNASSFTGNFELCGPPLPKKCETPHQAQNLAIDDEDDDTGIPMWFYIGLGLGYSVGISGVFLCLVLNRSWRIVYFRFVEQVTDWVYVVTVVNKRKLQRRMSSCTTPHKHTRGECE